MIKKFQIVYFNDKLYNQENLIKVLYGFKYIYVCMYVCFNIKRNTNTLIPQI